MKVDQEFITTAAGWFGWVFFLPNFDGIQIKEIRRRKSHVWNACRIITSDFYRWIDIPRNQHQLRSHVHEKIHESKFMARIRLFPVEVENLKINNIYDKARTKVRTSYFAKSNHESLTLRRFIWIISRQINDSEVMTKAETDRIAQNWIMIGG